MQLYLKTEEKQSSLKPRIFFLPLYIFSVLTQRTRLLKFIEGCLCLHWNLLFTQTLSFSERERTVYRAPHCPK